MPCAHSTLLLRLDTLLYCPARHAPSCSFYAGKEGLGKGVGVLKARGELNTDRFLQRNFLPVSEKEILIKYSHKTKYQQLPSNAKTKPLDLKS